jgi:hypothetical protein
MQAGTKMSKSYHLTSNAPVGAKTVDTLLSEYHLVSRSRRSHMMLAWMLGWLITCSALLCFLIVFSLVFNICVLPCCILWSSSQECSAIFLLFLPFLCTDQFQVFFLLETSQQFTVLANGAHQYRSQETSRHYNASYHSWETEVASLCAI